MGRVVAIDDPHDPRLADYVGLTDAALRRRIERPGQAGPGCFMAEGALVIASLLRSGFRVRSVLVTPPKLEALSPLLAGVDAPVFVARPHVIAAVAGFPFHRGALAVADRPPPADPAGVLAGAGRVVVAEALNDHENLGALFRNAAAFGIDAVLLGPRCCDPFSRRAVRVSMGHVLRVPHARLAPWPWALEGLRAAGWLLVALTPDAGALPLSRFDAGAARVALLVGAEGPGLSPEALAAADQAVRIPMADGVDSLNAATAAAVAFHHLAGLA